MKRCRHLSSPTARSAGGRRGWGAIRQNSHRARKFSSACPRKWENDLLPAAWETVEPGFRRSRYRVAFDDAMARSVSIIICTRDRAEEPARDARVHRQVRRAAGRRGGSPRGGQRLDGSHGGRRPRGGLTNCRCGILLEPEPGQTRARNAGLRASSRRHRFFYGRRRARAGQLDRGHVPAHFVRTRRTPSRAACISRRSTRRCWREEPFRSRRGWFASSEDVDPRQARAHGRREHGVEPASDRGVA